MKKLTSLEDLKSLIPKGYEYKNTIRTKSNIKKQTLDAHYSVKGRAGTPVIILKGFSNLKKEDLQNIAKPIKNKLGIGGSVKNNQIYFQGNKRDEIIKILEIQGHSIKRIGG